MSYGILFSKIVDLSFEKTYARVREVLEKEGFNIMTEIDVKASLEREMNQEFRNYKILGVCHTPFAFKALQIERNLGLLLPCNVIVQNAEGGKTQVAAIDPAASIQLIGNPALTQVTGEVRLKLKKVIDEV